MNEVEPGFDEIDESELSEQDLAILRAFEAMESWPPASTTAPLSVSFRPTTSELAQDSEMLQVFLTEAQEDLSTMLKTVQVLEHGGTGLAPRFATLQRAGHKLRGTAGAVDFSLTSLIAGQIEDIAERVIQQVIPPRTGLLALSAAVTALEECIKCIASVSQEPEPDLLLDALFATYQDLGVAIERTEIPSSLSPAPPDPAPSSPSEHMSVSEFALDFPEKTEVSEDIDPDEVLPGTTIHISSQASQSHPSATTHTSYIRVDARRLEKLSSDTEQLIERRAALESAWQQIEIALQESQAAQARLQQLEPLLAFYLTEMSVSRPSAEVSTSPSSLISRILNENPLRSSKPRLKRPHSVPDPANGEHWDEMDMERYSEKDKLLRSLKEARMDCEITSARVQATYAHFSMLQQEYLTRISSLRRDTLALRQAPLSTILPRLERVVKMSALGQPVEFEVVGEQIELDQEQLEQLVPPLMQLFRTCIADAFILEDESVDGVSSARCIWIHVRERGSEITLEVGFSMTIQGGAVNTLRDALKSFDGRLALERNARGGVSFLLHIPRLQGATRCLLVQVGSQQLVVPFVQVVRVLEQRQDKQALPTKLFQLNELLGFPAQERQLFEDQARLVLVVALEKSTEQIGVVVDQVIDEIELIIKPLKPYLQRPGIPGAAVDGKGEVVLMVDLPALTEQYFHGLPLRNRAEVTQVSPGGTGRTSAPQPTQARILVADDAVYLRHSVRQTLQHERYIVIEARDGMEALERLYESVPDICLLDIEMPNLNGYDVLSVIRTTPALASVKVIMLTSRSSEKHREHALKLGANAYLTKPCPQELLIRTVRELLKSGEPARM